VMVVVVMVMVMVIGVIRIIYPDSLKIRDKFLAFCD
jgi:hypothetical protein